LYGKEIAGYTQLLASFRELREKYEKRKEAIRVLLAETEALKKKAAAFLKKANRMTGHLTGSQRQAAGILYHPAFFDSYLSIPVSELENETPPALPELSGEIKSLKELKQGEIQIIRLIDDLKKKFLALDLLELRCRELLLSINKALEAFKHEYGVIRRRIYPLKLLSVLYKSLRRLGGFSYFSPQDLRELTVLGELTGHVLKIADLPIL
jgi:cell division protein FtsB